jgi:hypothetical protein
LSFKDAKILTILAHDIKNLVFKVKNQTNDIVLPKLPSNVQDLPLLKGDYQLLKLYTIQYTKTNAIESMRDILNQLVESTEPKINSSITHGITSNCLETLKLTNQYRHSTNKQPPTEPSYFIPNIFKPYYSLINQNAQWIDDQTRLVWAEQVANDVITHYSTTVKDLLINLNKTEEAETLNKSDEDKIRLQILLDIQQIGNEVTRYDIHKS